MKLSEADSPALVCLDPQLNLEDAPARRHETRGVRVGGVRDVDGIIILIQ